MAVCKIDTQNGRIIEEESVEGIVGMVLWIGREVKYGRENWLIKRNELLVGIVGVVEWTGRVVRNEEIPVIL